MKYDISWVIRKISFFGKRDFLLRLCIDNKD